MQGHLLTIAFHWIVFPIHGPEAGTRNSFELCGGGKGGVDSDEITIAHDTVSMSNTRRPLIRSLSPSGGSVEIASLISNQAAIQWNGFVGSPVEGV